MKNNIDTAALSLLANEAGHDPLEDRLRENIRATIEALIASVYLAGTNTRRVKRALYGLFQGAVSKDVVSRAWRKVKVDWDAWVARNRLDPAQWKAARTTNAIERLNEEFRRRI